MCVFQNVLKSDSNFIIVLVCEYTSFILPLRSMDDSVTLTIRKKLFCGWLLVYCLVGLKDFEVFGIAV